MDRPTRHSRLRYKARALFFLNAAGWLALGVASAWRPATGAAGQTTTVPVIAALMGCNALAMLLAGLALTQRRTAIYLLALALLAVNILLTFTDQFGLPDFLTLLVDLALAGLLLAGRRAFLPSRGVPS